MTWTLIVISCTLSPPTFCFVSRSIEQFDSRFTCESQVNVVDFYKTHPDRYVVKWWCRPSNEKET